MSDCFIIMPITTPESYAQVYANDREHFHHVIDHLFRPAIEKAGLNVISPIAEGADVIHAEIIKNLEQADLVLCDMSILNANVFFELGIRTAIDKPVCIVKDDATPKIPFDTTILNYHTYLSSLSPWTLSAQIDELFIHIQKSLTRSKGHNPLWRYFGLSTRATLPEEKGNIDEKLEMLSLQIEGLNQKIEKEPITRFKREPEVNSGRALFNSLVNILSARGITIKKGEWNDNNKEMNIYTSGGSIDEKTLIEITDYARMDGYLLHVNKRDKKA